ncbi:MAG TPA: hypothetical protein PKE69_10805 [Pyrinomonadaceae bacterium]|nr:hypothetical protein [Pyrinomonadaceae bacterium]
MKILKKILFISAAVFCFSFAAMAQQPTPTVAPKPTPPVINVGDKNRPKDEKPKDDDKKKPQAATLDLPRKFKSESA